MTKEELLELLHEKGLTDKEIGALLRECVDEFDAEEDHKFEEDEKERAEKYFGVKI